MTLLRGSLVGHDGSDSEASCPQAFQIPKKLRQGVSDAGTAG